MRLILVRHGNTDSNIAKLLDTGHPGAPLNETGLQQAEALVQTLADEPIEAVYSSDQTRAQQTATPLAEALGLPVQALPEFREVYAGDDDMSPDWRRLLSVFDQWFTDPNAKIPNGESWVEFLQRWEAGLATVEGAGVDCAAVVSHGAAIMCWVPFAASNLQAGEGSRWVLNNTDVVVLEGSSSQGWTCVSRTGVELPQEN